MGEPRTCPQCGTAVPADAPEGGCPNCMLGAGLVTGGAPSAPGIPSVEEVERRIPGFEILSVVGHGGMGVVYKARQKALDRVVALKVLPPATAASPGFAERFAREAKALARLQHPHIVAVHDFGHADAAAAGPLYWLVMEYVDGMNVREAMRAGRVGPKEALAIVPQICDALQYAHDRGVVHRDVKPENVLIDREGRVKVADFGLAKLASRDAGDASLTGAQQVMGTVHYMAPEQWQRPKDVDHRADIYSLGVVFYEMLTGELPIGRFDPPSKRIAVDVRVDEVVLRSLEREREKRWQHVSEVRSHVEAITSAPVAAPAAPAAPAAAPPAQEQDIGKRRNVGEVAILVMAAIGFAVAALATESSDWWWWCGGTAFAAGVCAVLLHEQNRRDAAASPPAAGPPPAPPSARGPWIAPRLLALVAAAGIALTGAMVWAAKLAPAGRGDAVMTLAALLGIALLTLLAGRWALTRRTGAAGSGASATGVLLTVFAVASLVLAATCLIPKDSGVAQPEFRSAAVAPAQLAPWEFDVELPAGVTAVLQPAARDEIWRKWATAQAVHGSAAMEQIESQYTHADWVRISQLPLAERKAACAKGLLGLPAADDSAIGAPLDGFRIRKVVLGGYDPKGRVPYVSALLVATDGRRTVRAAMIYAPAYAGAGDQWWFTVAPVQVE
jgi:protein kinase-like protein